MARPSLPRLALLGSLILAGGAVLWFVFMRPTNAVPTTISDETDDLAGYSTPADPRLADSIYRNSKPGVQYVGDARCTACHGDICTSYHAHPMGRSAALVGAGNPIEKYDATAKNPGVIGDYTFSITKTPDGNLHRIAAKDSTGAALPEYTVAANLAIGSGTRGRSYLCVENGSVWQSPLSWFSNESRWDISPGFDLGNGGRRAIVPDCLYCHVDSVEPIPHSLNRFREPMFPIQTAIGCERCHGPGELHANERLNGNPPSKLDTSIVNPKHLSNALQSAICEQCHLQGEARVPRRGRTTTEFRPGLPFESFVRVFVRHPDIADMQRSVGQFEQLGQSRCKTPTGEGLLCTSCHDPHKAPTAAETEKHYRDRCMACHEKKGCNAPLAERRTKNDSCIACHMPKAGSSNISHTSITDHRILKKPATPAASKGLQSGAIPLVPYHRGSDANDPEYQRDLGVALMQLAEKLPNGSGTQKLVGKLARDQLGASQSQWRGDSDSWLAMSRARSATGEAEERLKSAERAVRLAPDSESALTELSEAAMASKRYERAEEATTKLIAMNPKSVVYRLGRAETFKARKDWAKAEADCRAALAIQPLHPAAHLVLGICLHALGKTEDGKKEADTAIGLATHAKQKKDFRDEFLLNTR